MTDIRAVEIRAEVRQIKTMVDHSYNVILNLPEDCLEQAKVLMGWQGEEVRALFALGDLDSEEIANGRKGRGRKAKAGERPES